MFSTENKIYVRIDGHFFDLTNYKCHPGGLSILRKFHLKDATNDFNLIKGHGDGFVEGKLVEFEIKNIFLNVFLNMILHDT
jgi:cytochrome b involved in lipid metabolism